jgi:hypothetical protein
VARSTREEIMSCGRSGLRAGTILATAFLLAAAAPPGETQSQPASAAPHKSVYGKLESVDKSANAVFMKSDTGKRLAWRFGAPVIAEAAQFKPGDPLIVIYRQLPHGAKRVTALAFPGQEMTPTYVNMTGERIVLRSAPKKDDVGGKPDAGPVTETGVPAGGRAEVMEACWCCAVAGETCVPDTKSGLGRAYLVQCFK